MVESSMVGTRKVIPSLGLFHLKKGDRKKMIGQGNTAEIYPWGDHRVVKLFRGGNHFSSIQRELAVSREVEFLGLPVPKVYGRAQLRGRTGILYERITGPAMTLEMSRHPDQLDSFASTLAQLHHQIHQKEGSRLDSQKEDLKREIRKTDRLPVKTRDAVIRHLERLPEGDRLCHCDFHPDNILMSAEGPVVIDWMIGSRGAPAADIARTALILRDASLPPGMEFFQPLRTEFRREYLKAYFRLSPLSKEEIKAWEVPLAAARLNEKIPEDEKARLLSRVEREVETFR
ncbi:Ser/Thr protein kinase RdoA (MazF antagonist) [Melghirimyces profundicolus]|uniref:Ser/Thr protein kinase RdoA (MazF antagonist) n=1 Tax=Melghirimyces profundicolus TaxID=1242148 RepID=A0A2T6AYJ8_9BACL|nr:aminoglycoside phosphotransferase family protein [Melghirimyces profundicolus]PTX48890.1 Ser/Thr protein kinase RdoA (MazF antagonist) [Melghirimyces profundicolus]